MPQRTSVRAALLQADWTGDKESMIAKHEKYAREAAKQGAKVMCFQELFYGPYFCQVQDPQYYAYTEQIPDGPTTKRMQDAGQGDRDGPVVPMYEEDEQTTGIYYNTAAVIDADGTYLGKYRKTHIPHVKGFWEKFYFRPGNMGYPVFDTAVGKVGVYICYDRHFPEGARALGPERRRDRLHPLRDVARPLGVPLARRAGLACARQRLLRRHDQPRRHRAARRRRLLRPVATSSTRAASSSATSATRTTRSCWSATSTWTRSARSASLAVLPRPRPDATTTSCAPTPLTLRGRWTSDSRSSRSMTSSGRSR